MRRSAWFVVPVLVVGVVLAGCGHQRGTDNSVEVCAEFGQRYNTSNWSDPDSRGFGDMLTKLVPSGAAGAMADGPSAQLHALAGQANARSLAAALDDAARAFAPGTPDLERVDALDAVIDQCPRLKVARPHS